MKMVATRARDGSDMQIPPVVNKYTKSIPFPSLRLSTARLILFLIAVMCFANSWDGHFVFDDSEAVLNNKDVKPSESPLSNILIHDFWGRKLSNTSHKSYRPLTILTFRWNVWATGGLEPAGFHIPNILLHGVITILLLDVFSYLLNGVGPRDEKKALDARRRLEDQDAVPKQADTLSFLCALLFAVHPVHTESVAGIVGRADLLCALFFIFSFLSYVKGCTQDQHVRPVSFSLSWLAVSVVMSGLATLSKEQGITVIGICSAFDILSVCRLDIGTWLGLRSSTTSSLPRRPSVSSSSSPSSVSLSSNAIPLDKNSNGLTNGKAKIHPEAGIPMWIISLAKRQVLLAAAAIGLLVIRWRIMGSSPPTFTYHDNPHSFVNGTLLRALNYHYLYSINAWTLLAPLWLCFDWSMGCVPTIQSLVDPRLLAVVAFVLAVVFLAWLCLKGLDADSARPVILAVAMIIVPFLPATNLLFRVGFVVAERVLYLPSVGFCLLVGLGLRSLSQRPRVAKMAVYAFMLLLVVWMARSIQRSSEWRDELSLFKSGEKVCPLNAKIHYNIAKVNGDAGNIDFAIERYRLAIELNPAYDQAMNNLANILKDRGETLEAEQLLDKAIEVSPKFASAWMNRGIVKADLKKHEEAEKSYYKAISFRRNYPDCYYNLGNMYLDLQQHQKALDAFRNATILKPTHVNAWNNAIILLESLERYEKAIQMGEAALQKLPDHQLLLRSMGSIYGKQGNYPMSEKMFLKALEVSDDKFSVLSNLGVLYHRWRKYDQAMKSYQAAKSLRPHHQTVIDNIEMLRQAMAERS